VDCAHRPLLVRRTRTPGRGRCSPRQRVGTPLASRRCRSAPVLIGDPRGSFRTQALLCTDLDAEPLQILSGSSAAGSWRSPSTLSAPSAPTWASRRSARRTERAILRTTPPLLGLFSLVTLQAHATLSSSSPAIRQSTWYAKPSPTCSDALALVRRHLWTYTIFCGLPNAGDRVHMPRALVDHLAGLLCHAA